MLNTPEKVLQEFIGLQYIPGNSSTVEVHCSPEKLQAQFERIRNQWTTVGNSQPYASVLSDEKYLMENLKNNIAELQEVSYLSLNTAIRMIRAGAMSLADAVTQGATLAASSRNDDGIAHHKLSFEIGVAKGTSDINLFVLHYNVAAYLLNDVPLLGQTLFGKSIGDATRPHRNK